MASRAAVPLSMANRTATLWDPGRRHHGTHSAAKSSEEGPTDNVAERWAPTLIKNLHGRIRVSARTVLMELPNEFKACKAAMKFMSKIRQRQRQSITHSAHQQGSLLAEATEKPMSLPDLVERLRAIATAPMGTPLPTPLATPMGTPRLMSRRGSPKHRSGIDTLNYDSDTADHEPDEREVLDQVSKRLSEAKGNLEDLRPRRASWEDEDGDKEVKQAGPHDLSLSSGVGRRPPSLMASTVVEEEEDGARDTVVEDTSGDGDDEESRRTEDEIQDNGEMEDDDEDTEADDGGDRMMQNLVSRPISLQDVDVTGRGDAEHDRGGEEAIEGVSSASQQPLRAIDVLQAQGIGGHSSAHSRLFGSIAEDDGSTVHENS